MDEIVDSLKESILELKRIGLKELKNVRKNIEYIIKNNITDENIIEHNLDELLNLTYIFGSEVEDLYNSLVLHYKKINVESSDDYKKYFLSILNEEIS